MANPLRLVHVNHADTAVLTAGAAAVQTMPLSNLQDDDIQALWRSTGTGGDALIIDLGAEVEIGLAALINTSMRTTDLAHVRISNTDPTGVAGEIYNSGADPSNVDPIWAKFVHPIEPAVIGRYIRIGITMPTGAMSAGRLVIGPAWAPTRNMRFGFEPLWRDFSTRARSLGGNEFVDVKPRQRGYRFTIVGLTEIEAQEQVDQLNRTRGIGRDILICRDKDSDNLGRDTVWGLLEEPVRQRHSYKTGGGGDFYEIEVEVWDRV